MSIWSTNKYTDKQTKHSSKQSNLPHMHMWDFFVLYFQLSGLVQWHDPFIVPLIKLNDVVPLKKAFTTVIPYGKKNRSSIYWIWYTTQ